MHEATAPHLCQLPPGSAPVHDADEEVFLLYTALAARTFHADEPDSKDPHAFRGLGFLDSHQDVLTLEFTFQVAQDPEGARDTQEDMVCVTGAAATPHARRHAKRERARHRRKVRPPEEKTVSVQLAQDTTALRSRKGDTGSVLWRACIDFAQLVLRQWYAHAVDSLFNRAQLSEAHVLELGAGTGLLSILLSPLVRHYTVTDIAALVPLLNKNLAHNNIPHWKSSPSQPTPHGTVTADALDWLTFQNALPTTRRTLLASYAPADLLLVVDCIYHPSLLPALVTTIDALAVPGRTTVVVVVELRAEDVVRNFLELWLRAGDEGGRKNEGEKGSESEDGNGNGNWEIWHANVDGMMDGPYAIWVGWKKPPYKDVA